MSQQSALTNNFLITSTIGLMPDRMKRLIYVSSILAVVNNSLQLDRDMVVRLNEVLKLAHTTVASMRLPIQLSKVIWKNSELFKTHFEALKQASLKDACAIDSIRIIVDATPDWMAYNTKEEIANDLITLFDHQNRFVTR